MYDVTIIQFAMLIAGAVGAVASLLGAFDRSAR